MPIEINNGMMMEPTDNVSLFQKLYDYIYEFNKEWYKKIIPAPEIMLEVFETVSEIQNKRDGFPPLYRMFLERMGRNDGDLLSAPQYGTTNIVHIMLLHENNRKFCPDVFYSPYFLFFSINSYRELVFNISNQHEENIFEAKDGEIFNIRSESFKKLLFQSAFFQFERLYSYIGFHSSLDDLKQAMLVLGENNITDILDGILMKYGLTKVWFSDLNHYIALGVETSLYIQWGYREIEFVFTGFITSNDVDLSKRIAEDLSGILGVKTDKLCLS